MTSNLGRTQSYDKKTAEMLCKLLIGIQRSRQDPLRCRKAKSGEKADSLISWREA